MFVRDVVALLGGFVPCFCFFLAMFDSLLEREVTNKVYKIRFTGRKFF